MEGTELVARRARAAVLLRKEWSMNADDINDLRLDDLHRRKVLADEGMHPRDPERPDDPRPIQGPSMTYESMEKLGAAADELGNLLGAMALPMPAQFHLDQLKRALPGIRDTMRAIYVAQVGEDPWSTHPEAGSQA